LFKSHRITLDTCLEEFECRQSSLRHSFYECLTLWQAVLGEEFTGLLKESFYHAQVNGKCLLVEKRDTQVRLRWTLCRGDSHERTLRGVNQPEHEHIEPCKRSQDRIVLGEIFEPCDNRGHSTVIPASWLASPSFGVL